MALSRISNCYLLTSLSQVSHAGSPLGEIHCIRYAAVPRDRTKSLHVTSVRRYPDPPALPLPTNVSDIFANETGRFTPERARDIAAPVLLYGKNDDTSFFPNQLSKPTVACSSNLKNCSDMHVDSYDCFGAVSLNGTMQSNVPKPFCSNGKSMHLNMPGGQWARDGKYIAEDMQKSHYRIVRLPQLKLDKSGLTANLLSQAIYEPKYIYSMGYSTKPSEPVNKLANDKNQKGIKETPQELSQREKFKILAKEYGITVVIFHIGISLISLAACYAAVARGIDLKPIVHFIFNIENEQIEAYVGNSSTFLVAYGMHKLLVPLRFSISIGGSPFLVRYLRKIGLLKRPKRVTQTTQK
ncbi:hypothetical protein QLX08_003890 [Tetragonisca angustula]|uniref:DUF1279 domain-containing protein n=1 Tax=Tetragonisca angustula TaxID=166442 RepID=A0AAW1A5F5_9HYME